MRGPARVAASAQVFVADLDRLPLDAEDAHHLTRVLRLRAGETVVAADGRGHWRCCRFTGSGSALTADAAAGGEGFLEPDGVIEFEPAPAAPVTVAFVPVKGERPEWVVQKLTEIGVDHVAVLRSARSVVHWDGPRAGAAVERLRRVSRHAGAQSRRAWLPTVDGVFTLPELARELAPQPLALADPRGGALDASILALAVGPEGGWDPAEREVPGATGVALGPGILRAETAAVSAATLLCALRDRLLRPW